MVSSALNNAAITGAAAKFSSSGTGAGTSGASVRTSPLLRASSFTSAQARRPRQPSITNTAAIKVARPTAPISARRALRQLNSHRKKRRGNEECRELFIKNKIDG